MFSGCTSTQLKFHSSKVLVRNIFYKFGLFPHTTMSLRKWLDEQNLSSQAMELANLDVYSMRDLGVRIFWEDNETDKAHPHVPENVTAAFKASVAADVWSGQNLSVLVSTHAC